MSDGGGPEPPGQGRGAATGGTSPGDRAPGHGAIPAGVRDLFPPPLEDTLRELRRELHRRPELSWQEEETRDRLAAALRDLSVSDLETVAGTGLVARIPGRDPEARPVAVRGDIDALPIQEETELPFASENEGVMHACGHDVHAAWAVGAAALLAREPAASDVLVVLQPAEEKGEGAEAVLESGVLDGARAIFGGHVDPDVPVGEVVVQSGPIAASADFFEIRLRGSGSHAAKPHESRDPVPAAGSLVSTLYSLTPRRLRPGQPGVVSVTVLHAGEAENVVPDEAVVRGTIRAADPEARSLLGREVARIAESVARTHRVEAEADIRPGVPPAVNSAEAAGWTRSTVEDLLGEEGALTLDRPVMAGEDFAFYLEELPGCFVRVGAREAGAGPDPDRGGTHSPRFRPAEESLFVGAAVLAGAARRAADRA